MHIATQRLIFREPKKHSVLYDAKPGTPVAVSSLYIFKALLTEPWPKELEIEISVPEPEEEK